MTTAVFLGTSITADGLPTACAARLGWTEVNQGEAATGYLKRTLLDDTYVSFRGRLPGVIAANPDVLVVEGGVNDTPTQGFGAEQFVAEVPLFFAAVRAALPAIPVYVLAPWWKSRVMDEILAEAVVLKAACATYGCVYIDWLTVPWLTGTGKVDAPAGDGNSDVYMSAGGLHPSTAGRAYLGTRLAFAIRPPNTGLVEL
jgi:lysophospholipase L1-like esterase